MGITIQEVVNSHRLTTKTGDGRDLVVMSGTALSNFKGDGDTFRKDEMYVNIGPRGAFRPSRSH
jgi:hypothetical protein